MSRALADLELSLSLVPFSVSSRTLPYRLVESLKKNLEESSWKISPTVLQQRLVKDDEELAHIRKAVELWEKATKPSWKPWLWE